MRDSSFIDRTKEIPEDFYSTTAYGQELIKHLQSRDTSKPFFAYLAFTAPHWPLQAPRSLIDKYKGCYDDGPAALRAKRLEQLIKLGLISPSVEPAPMVSGQEEWENMSKTQRTESARKMEIFAAMVDMIDQSIGGVLNHLEESGELDNTFVLFMSDNGAEGALLEAMPIMGGSSNVGAIIDKYYDNSLDNMGNANSYIWYGPAWASASMAPSRGFKVWITEGGIRCPCIVRYPPAFGNPVGQNNGDGEQNAPRGAHNDSFATVMDILPTILDLANVPVPSPAEPFRNRSIVPVRGSSWLPHLRGKTGSFHDEEHNITGWELFGFRAIRKGPWKALFMASPRGKDRWELYNLTDDPGEICDLAEREPEVLDRLVTHWEIYHAETGIIDPDPHDKTAGDVEYV